MEIDKKIKTIFAGTPNISTPLLKRLFDDERFDVKLVITQVDKPAGRKMELMPPPVKSVAEKLAIPIFQPENINTPESIEKISRFAPDIIIVMAYGQILSKEILDIPQFGCLNIHASILPKYRGASPVQSALLGQETETGICLMRMEQKMDTGPVYEEFRTSIEPNDNSITLSEKLAYLASHNIPDAIFKVTQGKLSPTPQNESGATYCQRILKTEGLINW
ncbi:methionyl-tRNA formyltransferase, partial [Patescibacteria group bacterium]|nr:methionyl-tRNA formyltransferase [Patescibacteria group bacterium]